MNLIFPQHIRIKTVVRVIPRIPCTRPARFIIQRCGSVQSLFLVNSRMFAHSNTDGKWRFSGLAFQSD